MGARKKRLYRVAVALGGTKNFEVMASSKVEAKRLVDAGDDSVRDCGVTAFWQWKASLGSIVERAATGDSGNG